MKKMFKNKMALVLLCILLIAVPVTMIVLHDLPSQRYIYGQNAHADACTYRIIGTQQTTASPPEGTYQLDVNLYGSYDKQGAFCGQMYAAASISIPPRGVDGQLSAYLTNCHDNDLGAARTSVKVGGNNGSAGRVQTASISNGCGYASAKFLGSNQKLMIHIHTDGINASGSQQWEQWRG